MNGIHSVAAVVPGSHAERIDIRSENVFMKPKFITAYGPWRWFLKTAGFRAITMPWKSIYILDEHQHDEGLRRHELIHIEQIERDGPVKFTLLYFWYLVRYGYWNNPYEVEAYGKARN
jgi:hypothetical protein